MRATAPCLVGSALLAALSACSGMDTTGASPGDPGEPDAGPGRYAVRIAAVTFGANSGHGRDGMPDIVLGAPRGGGEYQGSLHTLSLGTGGSITLELGMDAVDGPGPDFTVFENAFRVQGTMLRFVEPGEVAVSVDGVTFTAFPCASDAAPYVGCAGVNPVLATGNDGGADPTDPARSGGDPFDLADIGAASARFIRITDRSAPSAAPTAGFDLDAVVVLNAAPRGAL